MEDISLHILDIAENSLRADAKIIEIDVVREGNLLRVQVIDDGRGMDEDTLAHAGDPFFTTKHKKTGLGIPLLTQAAETAGGSLSIDSSPRRGTRVTANFQWDHVDRPRTGEIADTILALIAGHPDRDYIYEEREGDRRFRFDTREIKQELDSVPISEPAVLQAIRELLKQNIRIKE